MKRENDPEIEKVLDIGDPFEFFVKQAFVLHRRLSLPLDFVHEAIALIKVAFGEEWLREKTQTKTRATALPLSTHPLGNYFAVSGPSDIVNILELAIYIKKLANVPRIADVLKSMKEDYGPGYLQLAFAYRFMRAGALNIELEPEAAHGRKADISFELSGTSYLVECFTPLINDQNTSQELLYSVGPIFDAIRSAGARIERVCIRLKRPIIASDRKRIERATVNAIQELGDRQLIEAHDEAAEISVEDISNMTVDADFPEPSRRPAGDADWAICEEQVSKDQIQEVRLGKSVGMLKSRILVWRAIEEKRAVLLEERVEELVEKIDAKLAQTHREDDPRRIVVVSIPEALAEDYDALHLAEYDSERLMNELHRRLMTKHDRVATLIFVMRVWTTKKRSQYRGFFLLGEEKYTLPDDFVNKLQELEGEADTLQDWA